MGVAVDPGRIIYVAERSGHRIRKIVLTGADPMAAASYTVSTLAGNGAAGSSDGIGAGASFSFPRGVGMGPDGTVYVADTDNHRVRRVSPAGEVVTIGGTGTAGTADGSGESATFNQPVGIAVVNGALVVSDLSGNTIRQMSLKEGGAGPGSATSWRVQTLAGSGGSSGSTDGSGSSARFKGPIHLTADRSGNLYIADALNFKVRSLRPLSGAFPVGVASGSAPSEPVQLANADGVIPNGNLSYSTFSGPPGAGETGEAKE